MTADDYVHLVRRHWKVIAACALLAMLAALFTSPSSGRNTAVSTDTTYRATATLLLAPETPRSFNLAVTRLYLKGDVIPERVAKDVSFTGTPAQLAADIVVGGDDKMGTLTITVNEHDGAHAALVANSFADHTVKYLQEADQASTTAEAAALQAQLDALSARVSALTRQVGSSSDHSIASAERDALLSQYQVTFQRLSTLQSQPASPAPLTVLSKASPVKVAAAATTLTAPKSRSARSGIGLALGLVLGFLLAVAITRFDPRLRSRAAAEEAFRLPVVAELPTSPSRQRSLVVRVKPTSAAAEAYRTLRSALSHTPVLPHAVAGGDEPAGAASRPGAAHPHVYLVTSPTPGAGTSITAANLAAAIAETGASVLVLEADFRDPVVAGYFGLSTARGISDLLAEGRPDDLASVVRSTEIAGVRVASAGETGWLPGARLARLPDVVACAAGLADVVLVDSPDLLTTSDTVDLLPHVGAVLMLARTGRTRADDADRASELLARVGVPAVGVALITEDRRRGGRRYHQAWRGGTRKANPAEATLAPLPAGHRSRSASRNVKAGR